MCERRRRRRRRRRRGAHASIEKEDHSRQN
jgi:hypothetical protein